MSGESASVDPTLSLSYELKPLKVRERLWIYSCIHPFLLGAEIFLLMSDA